MGRPQLMRVSLDAHRTMRRFFGWIAVAILVLATGLAAYYVGNQVLGAIAALYIIAAVLSFITAPFRFFRLRGYPFPLWYRRDLARCVLQDHPAVVAAAFPGSRDMQMRSLTHLLDGVAHSLGRRSLLSRALSALRSSQEDWRPLVAQALAEQKKKAQPLAVRSLYFTLAQMHDDYWTIDL